MPYNSCSEPTWAGEEKQRALWAAPGLQAGWMPAEGRGQLAVPLQGLATFSPLLLNSYGAGGEASSSTHPGSVCLAPTVAPTCRAPRMWRDLPGGWDVRTV